MPFSLRHRPGPNCFRRRLRSRIFDPTAIVWTSVISVTISKYMRVRLKLRVLHRAYEFRQRILRVAIEHAGDWFEEKWILESGKTFALAAFQNHYRLRMIDFQNWHAGNRAVGIIAGIGIHDVVCAD